MNRVSFESDEFLAGQAIEAGAYEEAVRLLRPLAERNSEYALLTLGWIYETGATGTPDKDAARSFYEHAVSQGSATAYRYLGWLLFSDGQETDARAAFERGAQLNNDECKSALTRLNDNAKEKAASRAFEEKDFDEAVRLLMPLAERNSEYALHTLGYISELGLGGTSDKGAARSYYKRAAAQGSGAAYFNLGRLLLREGEDMKARAAFQAGAEQAHVSCMSRLGRMMVDGSGGPADLQAGLAWLERAAGKGDILAQRKLLIIEAQKAKSIFTKLAIRVKIAVLAMKWARRISKHPDLEAWYKSDVL
jgi:TPR repeat protein